MNSPIRPEVMGITNLVSSRAMAHHSGMPVSAADYQMSQMGRMPDPIDRSDSPHSMHSMHNRYSPRPGEMSAMGYAPPPMHQMSADPMGAVQMNGMAPTSMPSQYPTPEYKPDPMAAWQQQVPPAAYMQAGPPQQQQQPPQAPVQQQQQSPAQQPASTGPVKAHPCRTCGKGFARRSDLARHERIHSGHRPHACDYPGCGKQFIQRSALTVHTRVHTGEKPHMCETCGKPFGDSSSLARHRRTHSGRRPYKCPYANCQKTFTRRTTLTRHQNHHVGTIEEAAAATVAALASRPNAMKMPRSSDIDPMSATGSPSSTPSPGHRPMSMSPSMMDPSARGNTHVDFQQYQPMPAHMRSDMYAPMRPTSHPQTYPAPPTTLEPNVESQQAQQQQGQQQQHSANSQPGSVAGSPHMSQMSWHNQQPASPQPGAGFMYPEPNSYTSQLYYNAPPGDMRRDAAPNGMVNMS